jgi:glycerophosphoryl diester phosphodiesterase
VNDVLASEDDDHNHGPKMTFDIPAHRGGIALTVENTLPAFAKALELGVTTLEFDTIPSSRTSQIRRLSRT